MMAVSFDLIQEGQKHGYWCHYTCSHIGALKLREEINGYAIWRCCDEFQSVRNNLIIMFSRYKDLRPVDILFRSMKERKTITWNLMLHGYTHLDKSEEASFLFQEMLVSQVEPNYVTIATILPLCARVVNLPHAEEFYCCIHRHKVLEECLLLWNALVVMYGRSRKFLAAKYVFNLMQMSDEVTYDSLIAGYILSVGVAKVLPDAFNEASPTPVASIAMLSVTIMEILYSMFQNFSHDFNYEVEFFLSVSPKKLKINTTAVENWLQIFVSPGMPLKHGNDEPLKTLQITPGQVTVITTDDHSAAWHNFTRFKDAERGSHVSGMSELKKYFQRFGYLSIPDNQNDSFTDVFDSRFELAVILYQKKFGLPVSGKLDSETISAITSPRCGVSDTGPAVHATKHFTYFYGRPRWDRGSRMTLTYAFSPTNMIDSISLPEIRTVFQRSFLRWASVIPVNFTEIKDYGSANIKIGFFSGDHGDGEPFDGVLGVLGHAFSPENGRFHLDEAETWAVDFGKVKSKAAVDLESVATHEIGHILGLAHSSVKEAVMYPSLKPRSKKVDLKLDDVEGVQSLYGSNPNFKYSSLLESENSFNKAAALNPTPFVSTVSCSWLLLPFLLLFMIT
ncbi:hypothetical protein V6N13_036418 [Hibiscus sabdariffa]